MFGRRNYVSRAQFLGTKHEIGIECSGGVLKVKVDGEIRLVVKRLTWKFRGNEKIYVGGIEVEFFWDVFNLRHVQVCCNGRRRAVMEGEVHVLHRPLGHVGVMGDFLC